MKKSGTVVVRRIKKQGHSGHHGGSWKVALADFAIAMMALFLLLWIINSTNEDQKAAIAAYFEDPGVFSHKKSNSLIPFGGLDTVMTNPTPAANDYDDSEFLDEDNKETQSTMPDFTDLIEKLKNIIGGDQSDGKYEEYIYLEHIPEGLRIVILDSKERSMFERGSSILNPFYQDLLLELAPILEKVDRRLMISGHTDSASFHGTAYGNWELSSARAQVARRTLVFGRVSDSKVTMVLGMADRTLRDPENPEASANRRIEILVLAYDMERRIKRMFAPIANGEPHENQHSSPIPDTLMEEVLERAEKNQQTAQ